MIDSCAVNLSRYRSAPATGLPAQHVLDHIPFFPQADYQCGPAALAMTLAWSGLSVTPQALTSSVYTPSKKGSIQPAMIGAARRHGRIAYILSGPEDLIREIAAGHPVIVLQNLGLAWYPVWHYAVAVGYDLKSEAMLLHSGRTARKRVPLKLFHRTWARSNFWGMMTLPPKEIPATATDAGFVESVFGLEQAGQLEAALEGYRTALNRWPANLAAGIGLANVYYALGDFAAAERSLRATIGHVPESGAAYNNLAQVLWDQGKGPEALKAAQTAVRLGGKRLSVYQKTLNEIQKGLGLLPSDRDRPQPGE